LTHALCECSPLDLCADCSLLLFFAVSKKSNKRNNSPARAAKNFRFYSVKIFAAAFGRRELLPLNAPLNHQFTSRVPMLKNWLGTAAGCPLYQPLP